MKMTLGLIVILMTSVRISATSFSIWTAGKLPCSDLPSNCTCLLTEKYSNIYRVNCRSTTEFSRISGSLQQHFKNVTLKKLTFRYSTGLRGLQIQKLQLHYNRDTEISNEAFKGILRLKWISLVGIGNLKSIPSSAGDHNLTHFRFKNVMEYFGSQLQNVSSLEIVVASHNKISLVSPDAFKHCVGLQSVDFSYNQIEKLDKDLFRNAQNLKSLCLINNQIKTLEGVLSPIASSISVLVIKQNLLKSISDIISTPIPKLSKLLLDDNQINMIKSNDFPKNCESLKSLTIRNNNLQLIEDGAFDNLRNLEGLYLSKNNLTRIPKNLFTKTTELEDIYLDCNEIEDITEVFFNLVSLKKLVLGSNKLLSIERAFSNLTSLQTLILENNMIEWIPEDAFSSMNNLENLHLQKNNIRSLNNNSFAGIMKTLQILDLSQNRLENLGNAFSGKNFHSLRYLTLNDNKLSSLSSLDLNAKNLHTLILGANYISKLNKTFIRMPSLRKLFLYSNKLSTVAEDTFNNTRRLSEISLEGNTLSCDCRILWLVKRSKERYFLRNSKLVCSSPKWLAGRDVTELNEDDLTNWKEDCPEGCKSCKCFSQEEEMFVHLSCDERNLTSFPNRVPYRTAVLSLSGNNIEHVPENMSQITPYLKSLDLSNNLIKSLGNVEFPLGLTELNISRNNLKRFPEHQLTYLNLSDARFSDNPWICECSEETFRRWLHSNSKIILDFNYIKCSTVDGDVSHRGKDLAELMETDFCPVHLSEYIITAFGILGFLLCVSAMCLGYIHHKMTIKVWLYSNGLCLRWVKEEELDEGKTFDAFLAFSSDEQYCVDQILKEMEGNHPNYNICVHYRDFIGGELILSNIAWAVSSSKRIIILLSRSFLESEWTMQEFREAHRQTMEEKRNRIILIMVGKIPSLSEVPPDLRAYMQNVTYLRWEEKYFWQKLRYAMPRNAVKQEPDIVKTNF